MTAAFGVQAKESRYIGGRTALARRIPTKKKEEKNIERPAGAMVYVSMNNFAGCIEGATVNTGASDLKSRKTNGSEPSLVGGVGVPALGMLTITGSNMHRGIEMPVAQPYLFVPAILSFALGGPTGANAGQRSNTGATVWWTPWSGGLQGLSARVELKSTPHWSRNHGNPCAEKWMHTRPQQIISSRSRMGKRESDAHVRGAAVAQRLHSAIFGSGELPTENAELQRLGGR
jgi:hypothetical protein